MGKEACKLYPDPMTQIAFIGFGEVAATFARRGDIAYDVKTGDPEFAPEKWRDYERAGVKGSETAAEALAGASFVMSLVTAGEALAAARNCSRCLAPGALWLDMNSVAPATKQAARAIVEDAGCHYLDIAIMAPVLPRGRAVPLLVSGIGAEAACAQLSSFGFPNARVAGSHVGDASAIKMIRSVMIKGVEALTAECVLAADRAGVTDAVLASLDADGVAERWSKRAGYNLGRMLVHGERRAAEMEEAARTLMDLGIDPVMCRAAVLRQRELGKIGGTGAVPDADLSAMLGTINQRKEG